LRENTLSPDAFVTAFLAKSSGDESRLQNQKNSDDIGQNCGLRHFACGRLMGPYPPGSNHDNPLIFSDLTGNSA
jgi:hypothetical protein